MIMVAAILLLLGVTLYVVSKQLESDWGLVILIFAIVADLASGVFVVLACIE